MVEFSHPNVISRKKYISVDYGRSCAATLRDQKDCVLHLHSLHHHPFSKSNKPRARDIAAHLSTYLKQRRKQGKSQLGFWCKRLSQQQCKRATYEYGFGRKLGLGECVQ